MKFHVWIEDRKEETLKEIDVPLNVYEGIKEKRPSPMSVKDRACSDGFFSWSDYTDLRVKKL